LEAGSGLADRAFGAASTDGWVADDWVADDWVLVAGEFAEATSGNAPVTTMAASNAPATTALREFAYPSQRRDEFSD
jgi:hypothetical protein